MKEKAIKILEKYYTNVRCVGIVENDVYVNYIFISTGGSAMEFIYYNEELFLVNGYIYIYAIDAMKKLYKGE